MKGDKLPRIVFFEIPAWTKWKVGCPRIDREEVMMTAFKEAGTKLERAKNEALDRVLYGLCSPISLLVLG